MKSLFPLFLGFLVSFGINAQPFTQSNLPIVVINTNGVTVPDEPKIVGQMGIIDNGPGAINYLTDAHNHYSAGIGIETRGNSTQDFEKKTYSIELRDIADQDSAANLLNMGKEEDWILHAMVIDKTQLRIPMSFYLAQRMGHYAAEWRYVEVVLNGDYRGLYILTEKIKRDDDRLKIAKLDADDLAGDSLTGGYILRIDWLDEPQGFASDHNSLGGAPMFFQYYYPKASKIHPTQAAYIKDWMSEFEEAVFASDYTNQLGNRYDSYINLNSFVDFLIINELSKNADGYKLSSYVHKDKDSKGGKLNAGPIWDFDQTYGDSEVCSCTDYTGWTYLQNQSACEDFESMPMWWDRMMQDPVFQNRLGCRWTEMRNTILHQDTLFNWMDNDTTLISEAIGRNFTKWDYIGQNIWSQAEPVPQSYEEEIDVMKTWMTNRLNWLDNNMPGICANDIVSGVPEVLESPFTVYPNPASSMVVVQSSQPYVTVSTLTGLVVNSVQVDNGRCTIDVSGLPAGVYLISGESHLKLVVTR